MKRILSIFFLTFLFVTGVQAGNQMITLMKYYKKAKMVSPDKAKEYYEKMYELAKEMIKKKPNDPRLNFIMGKCYLNGYGVKLDYEKAYKYFTKAANKGNKFALCGQFLSAIKSKKDMLTQMEIYKKIKTLNKVYTKCKKRPDFLEFEKKLTKGK